MSAPSTLYEEKRTLVDMVTALQFSNANHEKKQIAIMAYINQLRFVPSKVKKMILNEVCSIIEKPDSDDRTKTT